MNSRRPLLRRRRVLPLRFGDGDGACGFRVVRKVNGNIALELEEAGPGVVDDSHCNASTTDIVAESFVRFNSKIALGLDEAGAGTVNTPTATPSAMDFVRVAPSVS